MKIIILAGGSGTRLWPLSRERYPKQFIKLQGKESSLFQDAFLRAQMLTDLKNIYVVTNSHYKFLVMGAVDEMGLDYDEEQILVEPEGKNTLPAIYAGVDEIIKSGHDHVLVLSSDHLIKDNQVFVDSINSAIKLSDHGIVTFGILPDRAHTGYGYIEKGETVLNGFMVSTFKEKPTRELALDYIKNGYLWNSGIFMFTTKTFIQEVEKFVPEIYDAFNVSDNLIDAFALIKNKISIDYGILEKSKKVMVMPMSISWSDLGSFDAFYEVFPKDDNGNIASSEHILMDSKNNYIHSEKGKLIATVGIEDLIIVDKKDALLICKKDASQEVKKIVEKLKSKGDRRVEYHTKDYRPWGNYRVLEEENTYKIKHITVGIGKKISYQLHHHRSEHWIVVSGMAKVTIDDEIRYVAAGESLYIKSGQKHRLENPGKISLELIEVQMGVYLEEDDIIRFDDEYGRK